MHSSAFTNDPRYRLANLCHRSQQLVEAKDNALTWIRRGYDWFRQLQLFRIDPELVPTEERFLSLQQRSVTLLEIIPEDLQPLAGYVIPLWRLCNMVNLAEWESIGGNVHSAAERYVEWHRAANPIMEQLNISELRTACMDSEGEFSEDQWAELFSAVQQLFFQGERRLAAEVLSICIERIRSTEGMISHELETLFHEVLRLLVDPLFERDHHRWRSRAGALIGGGRSLLTLSQDEVETSAPLSSLCMVMLDVLVVASESDGHLLCDLCNKLSLDPTWRLAAIAAVQRPWMDLQEISAFMCDFYHDASYSSWKSISSPLQEWYVKAVFQILTSRNYADIVNALESCTNTYVSAELEEKSFSNEETAEDAEEGGQELSRWERFALLYMAAHLGDLCAPPFFAVSPHDRVLFKRNELVDLYVRQLEGHGATWRIGVMYTAFTPLANPEVLTRQHESLICLMCQNDDMLRRTLRDLRQINRLYLDRSSPHQISLRKVVARKIAVLNAEISNTEVDALWQFFDQTVIDSFAVIVKTAFEHYWALGHFSAAAVVCRGVPSAVLHASNWGAALESKLKAAFERFNGTLTKVDADHNVRNAVPHCVVSIGEAVRSGFVPLSSLHPSLAELLSLCADMFDVLNRDLSDSQLFHAIWHVFDTDVPAPTELKIMLLELALLLLRTRRVTCTYDEFLTLHLGLTLIPDFVGCSKKDSPLAVMLLNVAQEMMFLQTVTETRPTLTV